MTALRDAIDYTTLGWVKPEVDETLRQARIEIEGFAEDPTDASWIRLTSRSEKLARRVKPALEKMRKASGTMKASIVPAL